MSRYFATVARGLESVAAAELTSLGAQHVKPDFAGVQFTGDRPLLYRVNLCARTIFRVLVPIAEFRCRNARELYRSIQAIDWREHLLPDQTLAIDCTGGNRQLNHTHFTALQVKNAIVDQQRQQAGRRSSVDPQSPDLRLNLHIYKQRGTLSLDSSGRSLHRRGYRAAMGQAPLKETLAAALIQLTGWQGDVPLYDPLCGSGTFPLEAALIARRMAPGRFRKDFGFERWRNFEPQIWAAVQAAAQEQELATLPVPIVGSDRDPEMLQQARANARNAELDNQVRWHQAELSTVEAPSEPGILLCNPPYGHRIGIAEELGPFYKLLGDVLKQRFTGWTAYILTTKVLSKCVGLQATQRIPVYNGALACTLLKYELY
ncbi:MAG: THUMP domain-containing class I SAM-dependent RNA methyltransferase [Spirulinaceae cyanobacterium]